MIPLAALEILRRWWPAVVALVLLAVGAVAGLRLVSLGRDLERTEANVAYLEQRLESCQRSAITVDEIRADVRRCRDDVLEAQAKADRWLTAYENARRQPPRVIEIPVEVAAPGTPCVEAAVELGEWLAGEVHR